MTGEGSQSSQGETTRLDVAGRATSVWTGGSSDGPPVLLIHGGGFDHARISWQHLFPNLAQSRRVVAPDLPGFGDTEPGDFTHDVAGFGGWILALIDELGIERADVCGVSLGGGIALWLALNHRERVRRLIPVDPYGVAAKAPMHKFGALFSKVPATRWTGSAIGASSWLARVTLKSVFHDDTKVTDELVEMARRAARDTPGFATFGRFQREEVRWDGLKTCLADDMARIAHPTLVVQGRHDGLVPLADVERAVATMPDARLAILETGHWPMLEAPDAFNALVLDFLTEDRAVASEAAL